MWARVARFEGAPDELDERIERLRTLLDSGTLPPEVEDAKLLFLADRATGGVLAVTLFESEDTMMKADAAMNAGAGHAGARQGVEFYEVPLHKL
jgi:hypothetical protein